jgi:hypothetical protein
MGNAQQVTAVGKPSQVTPTARSSRPSRSMELVVGDIALWQHVTLWTWTRDP